MSNLFIIGNGFDLAHGLKTSYHNFRNFLIQLEKEECVKVGEVSISQNIDVLKDEKIKYHFNNIVIPTKINALSQITNIMQLKDFSTGKTPLESMDEINKFLNDADRIVQWIKHGSGQYYVRENEESQLIKRFIAILEPKTGLISHNTNLNTTSAYWQAIESEFGNTVVKLLQYGNNEDETPLWLTLRLFIKMMDLVAGKDWADLEESLGTYNFEMIFNLFKDSEPNDDIYMTCLTNFFTGLYYNLPMLFNLWIIFTEIAFEEPVASENFLSDLHPRIKKKQNNIELSLMIKDANINDKFGCINPSTYPMSKNQLLDILARAKHNYFFTFNYTQTLERIYNISESYICHIHGMAKDKKNINNLASEDFVFGHGQKSFDSNVTDVVSTAYNIIKKPVNQCMANNQLFFEKLYNVNNIYSFGFSFGDVDMPYIEKICNSINNTNNVKWYFNDFRISEYRTLYEEKIHKIGFNGTFDTFHID